MKLAIVGAGPSGLFLAILLKKRLPGVELQVYEQNPREATFGFGVVLADNGLSKFRNADKAVTEDLKEAMLFSSRQTIVTHETPIVVKRDRPGLGGGAIPRIDLLSILQHHAEALKIPVQYGVRINDVDSLDSDLIVGADGVNSLVRSTDEAGFGTSRETLTNHFAWYGVGKAFPNPALVFRKARGGHFVAHYYPYSETMSTFVAECDDATWRKLGMDEMTDDARKQVFQEVFASELEGFDLISNNSHWRQFPAIRNEHWFVGKKVLIGDALTSAHFSIGSGTRIAMEDAIALAEALIEHPNDLKAALNAYDAARRPEKNKLIKASEASYRWYEDFPTWIERYSPTKFVYEFMTRTGRVDPARLRKNYPELVDQFVREGVLEPSETNS